ncbi:hypothetical protein DFH29DRAFT_881867, partial [Suillus ampliporus]
MEENALEILQEIMECGILNSSPHRKIAARPVKYTAPDTGDAGWNTDTDMTDLLAAIENCGILDKGKEILTDNKWCVWKAEKESYQKNRESTKKQACAKDGLKSSARPIIHATISPVPEDPPTDGNVVKVNHSNGKPTGNHKEVSVMVIPYPRQRKSRIKKVEDVQKTCGGFMLDRRVDEEELQLDGELAIDIASHVLGRHILDDAMHIDGTNPNDWEAWGGPRYWRNVAVLHGWTGARMGAKQSGLRPDSMLRAGASSNVRLDRYGNVPPIHIKCGHILRMDIFHIISGRIEISCRDYMMLLDGPQTHWIAHEIPHEDVISAIQRGQQLVECLGLLEQLAALSTICTDCRHTVLIQDPGDRFHTVNDHNVTSYDDDNQFEDEEVVEQCRVSEVPSNTAQKTQTRPVLHRLRRDHRQKPGRHSVICVTISPTMQIPHKDLQGMVEAIPKDDLDVTMGQKHVHLNLPEGQDKFEFIAHDTQVTASQQQVCRRSHMSDHEFQDESEEHIEESQWSPPRSSRAIQDDDYRPSPPPLPEVRSPSLEAPLSPLAKPTVVEIACRAMARPVVWTSAWHNWRTLGLNERLEATVANFYLLHVWYEALSRSRMRYVDLCVVMANNMADEDMELFRRNHFVPHEGACPVVPVGFIVHDSECFFAVILDFQKRTAHVLGRQMSDGAIDVDGADPHDWSNWRGPEYWRKIAALHDWSPGDVTDVSVIPRDSTKTGVDCGPMACSVLEQCMISGVDERGNLPPFQVQCGHKLRIHMLRMVAGCIKMSCSDYLMLLDNRPDDWLEDDMPDEE